MRVLASGYLMSANWGDIYFEKSRKQITKGENVTDGLKIYWSWDEVRSNVKLKIRNLRLTLLTICWKSYPGLQSLQ
jgi:hypothetical protein